ncbi:MAG: hypothetical protein LQ347_006379, partial [Umbilicaria vellea]
MSQSTAHNPPIPPKRLDYTLPPKVDGERWIVHRRQAKLIKPHDAGAFPALHGSNTAMGSNTAVAPNSLSSQISKGSGELAVTPMPSVPSDDEHTSPVHFMRISAISQKELDDKINDA